VEERVGEDAATRNHAALCPKKTVAGCIDAEFAAYAALADVRREESPGRFAVGDPQLGIY
jgi:hypothetical protein